MSIQNPFSSLTRVNLSMQTFNFELTIKQQSEPIKQINYINYNNDQHRNYLMRLRGWMLKLET